MSQDRNYIREAAVSLTIAWIIYQVCRAVWRWPLVCVGLWGALGVACWLGGMDGWDAIMGFLGIIALLVLLACGALWMSGHEFLALCLFLGFAFLVEGTVNSTTCVGDVCYAIRPTYWFSIETPFGWVHELPAGGMSALPNPGPGLFQRLWTWLLEQYHGGYKHNPYLLTAGFLLGVYLVYGDRIKAWYHRRHPKDAAFLEQGETRFLR